MEKVTDLKDLLKHEILDLYSAEEQIIEALPAMIEKAENAKLKTALSDHLKVTEEQKSRLDEIKELLNDTDSEEAPEGGEKRGFFSRLFGGASEKCKGMEGLISEGQKMLSADMSPEALDAAIIASAQKIEHYEISGYGTARAFARELNLGEVASKLEQTLNEEYAADDLLTKLAVGKINVEAEFAQDAEETAPAKEEVPASKPAESTTPPKKSRKSSKTAASKPAPVKKIAAKKSPSKSSAKKVTTPVKKSAAKGGSKAAVKKAAVKSKSAAKKAPVKLKSAAKKAPVKSKVAAKKAAVKSSSKGNKSKAASKSKSSRGR